MRRALVVATIAAVVIAGTAVAYTRVNSDGDSPTRHAAGEVYGTFGSFGIASGVRAEQVTARLGEPDQRRNSCWTYRIHGSTFHGIKVIQQIAGMDAVRYCFYDGVVAMVQDHWRPGTFTPQLGPWQAPVTYGCGNGPCKHQAP